MSVPTKVGPSTPAATPTPAAADADASAAATVSYSAALDGSNQLPALLEVLYHGQKETTPTTAAAAAAADVSDAADASESLQRPDAAAAAAAAAAATVATDADETDAGGAAAAAAAAGEAAAGDVEGSAPASESTDCGSLSKSSSDGDPVGVVSRKRPPTKLKSRRRNILSFPHHISVDELRLIQVPLVCLLVFLFFCFRPLQSATNQRSCYPSDTRDS